MWNINSGGTMLSGIGFSLNPNDEELQWRYIIRRLMSYGLTSTGNLNSDKHLLQKVERGQIPAITETTPPKTENFTENSDSTNIEQTTLELERKGAEQLGILIKLRLGLL